MINRAAALLLLALAGSVRGEVLRSSEQWAIHDQAAPAAWAPLVAGRNLADGRPVKWEPEVNYSFTKDAADARQLTDGEVCAAPNGKIYNDRQAVGWGYQPYVRVIIDLGGLQPVGRVVFRVQGGIDPTNTVPRSTSLLLSADGTSYTPVRSLTERTNPEDNPALTFEPLPGDQRAVYAFELRAGYQARFVRLDFATHGHLILDEVAVMAAEGQVAELPPPPAVAPEYRDNVFDRRDQYQKLTAAGNLIAGQELVYAPQPRYRLTTNETDPLDLTDGKFGERTDERIWFEKGAVCWQHSPLITILADLGAEQPIDRVVARFLGGAEQGGLVFPDSLRVLLSHDGQTWYLASDRHKRGLDDLSAEAYDLPEQKVAWVHNFVLPVGRTARHVALQIEAQKQFICSDEIAVVKGAADLPKLAEDPARKVTIVTSGVAFDAVTGSLPVCANWALRSKLQVSDARSGNDYLGPCTLVLDLPADIRWVAPEREHEAVQHDGRPYRRYRIAYARGKPDEFYLQADKPDGQGTVYTYGDAGKGLENERAVPWQAVVIPKLKVPKRLHVSLAWSGYEGLAESWPNCLEAYHATGFNCVAVFARYWKAEDVPRNQALLDKARAAGFQIIVNESPAGAEAGDRKQPETKSQLAAGPSEHVCPSYRGQYYRKEHAGFGQHAVWARPDYIFYDIEAYWGGCQEAPRCERCKQRFAEGKFQDWDAFYAALGREIHVDLKKAVDDALAAAGIKQPIVYGSYRTQPITKLNDGLFDFGKLYPDLLQIAMPSLYVAGDAMAVARNISANRALMKTNDIVPWLSTGTYGEYQPHRTRDMILEALANGARGITYYYYRNFDPAHFMYHADAVRIASPIEDIFADGAPMDKLSADVAQVKVCGMRLRDDAAVLVSNYVPTVAADRRVKVTTPMGGGREVYDAHDGKRLGQTAADGSFTVPAGSGAHLYYLGQTWAGSVGR